MRCTGTIPASDRRRFHARAGEFGARLEGASEIHASVHYERAGLRRQAFEAALAGAREAARLSARREAFELYRRAVENMPDDLDPAERAAILTDYAEQALSIEEHDAAAWAAERSAEVYRSLGRPAQAIACALDRLGDRPTRCTTTGRTSDDAAALWTELAGLEDDLDVLDARATIAQALAIDALDARDVPEARRQATTLAAIADELGDDEWRMVAAWKAGLADVIDGDVQAGLARVGDLAFEAERRGWEGSGVTAFREASSVAASALDYRAAVHWIDEGVRYSNSVEQSHCAHVMRSTLAVVSWAGADPDEARSRARQAIVDKGCRAWLHDRALGARATWP